MKEIASSIWSRFPMSKKSFSTTKKKYKMQDQPTFHLPLGQLDHLAAEGGDRLGNLHTGQFAAGGAGEAVHRVGAHLQRQLPAVEHHFPGEQNKILKIHFKIH